MKWKVEAGPHHAALAEPAGNHHAVSARPHHHLRPAPHPVCGGHGPWATVVASRAEAREIDAVPDRRACRFELPIPPPLVIGDLQFQNANFPITGGLRFSSFRPAPFKESRKSHRFNPGTT